jgi:predicted membrane protein
MHPPRPERAIERVGFADRLTDWLLTHCPFTALTLLTLLVVGYNLTVPRPVLILVPVVCADVVLNVARRVRRTRKAHVAPAMGPRAVA